MKGALIGTLWLMMTLIPIALILGVGSAIYLEEYAKDNAFTKFIRVNISNLASVPSIVYGLLGATIFVALLQLGNSVIAAALTLALLILPVIIVASQEAIRSVPQSVKEASYGLGANKWQTIQQVVLPAAIPKHYYWCYFSHFTGYWRNSTISCDWHSNDSITHAKQYFRFIPNLTFTNI